MQSTSPTANVTQTAAIALTSECKSIHAATYALTPFTHMALMDVPSALVSQTIITKDTLTPLADVANTP